MSTQREIEKWEKRERERIITSATFAIVARSRPRELPSIDVGEEDADEGEAGAPPCMAMGLDDGDAVFVVGLSTLDELDCCAGCCCCCCLLYIHDGVDFYL